MKKPDTIEKDVNEIRLKIYEETKNMTLQQRKERLERITNPIIKKYGFKVIPNAENKIKTS